MDPTNNHNKDLWSYQNINNTHAHTNRASNHSTLLAHVGIPTPIVHFTSMGFIFLLLLIYLFIHACDRRLFNLDKVVERAKRRKQKKEKSHSNYRRFSYRWRYTAMKRVKWKMIISCARRFTVTQDILNGSNQVAFVFI